MGNNKKKTIEEDGHVFIHSSTLFLSSLFCPSFEARGGEEERAWEWGCLFIGMIYLLILELAKAAAITSWLGPVGDNGNDQILSWIYWISYASTH